MENTYSLKINYNDLMNAFNRSLKLRANRQNHISPSSSGTGSTNNDNYVFNCNKRSSY